MRRKYFYLIRVIVFICFCASLYLSACTSVPVLEEVDFSGKESGVYLGSFEFSNMKFFANTTVIDGKLTNIELFDKLGNNISTKYWDLLEEVIDKQTCHIDNVENKETYKIILRAIDESLRSKHNYGKIMSGKLYKRTQVIYKYRPRYPEDLRLYGIEGRVTLGIVVDKNGKPSDIHLKKSSGSDELDDVAVEAGWDCRFSPMVKAGEKVESKVLMHYNFKLKGEEYIDEVHDLNVY
ncbi:energy transducer TonB [Candidatus Dependentiae bacterium]|nr:energy transducer TonB [Candidatus Dependentiae bacterium]